MKTLAIIPSRLQSTRFPRKPLVKICGREMILRTIDRVKKCNLISNIWVASDSEEILNIVNKNYLNNNLVRTVLTDSNCKSGTDRLVDALVNEGYDAYNRKFPWDGIINVQGDEPFVSMESVEKCLNYFYSDINADMATIVTPIRGCKDNDDEYLKMIRDSNIVKCKYNHDENNYAINFSRKPFYDIDNDGNNTSMMSQQYHHIGVYAYRPERLYEFTNLKSKDNPESMENLENLEQLRAIEANWKVKVVNVDGQHIHGIDTYEQYKTLQQMMTNKILMTSNDEI